MGSLWKVGVVQPLSEYNFQSHLNIRGEKADKETKKIPIQLNKRATFQLWQSELLSNNTGRTKRLASSLSIYLSMERQLYKPRVQIIFGTFSSRATEQAGQKAYEHERQPDRTFQNFGASKSVARRSWTTYNTPIVWDRGSKTVKGPVGQRQTI